MLNRRTFIGLTLVSPWAVSAAVDSTPEDIDSMLTSVRESNDLPALAAGAMKGGKVLAVGAVGVRKIGMPAAVTLSDKFHIGSDTKAMTATLVGMQVEQGKLRWNQTLSEIFPERASKMNDGYRKVTLEMLLTHYSGAPANSHEYGLKNEPVTSQRLKYLDSIINQTPAAEPGSKFAYSNAGYIIVGTILEHITGKPWESLIEERLFHPLGMTSAGFGSPSKPNGTDQPWGHTLRDGKFTPDYGDNPPALGPAGTVHCSILDYLKFADFHASGGKRPPGLLSPTLFDTLHIPAPGRTYAMGWGTAERAWAHGQALTHAGSNTKNFFVVWIAPKTEFSIAVATNAAGPKVAEAVDQVASKLVQKFAS